MKTQHTPGPWQQSGSRQDVVYDNTGQLMVADCFQINPLKREASANARLISLAPEMADTLRSLVSLCPSKEGLGGHAPIGAFIQIGESARALLAKLES